jgi:hypothetical protein
VLNLVTLVVLTLDRREFLGHETDTQNHPPPTCLEFCSRYI